MDADTQERIAHLEREVADLSDEVTRLAAELNRLGRLVRLVTEREAERDLDAGGSVPLADRPPPHW